VGPNHWTAHLHVSPPPCRALSICRLCRSAASASARSIAFSSSDIPAALSPSVSRVTVTDSTWHTRVNWGTYGVRPQAVHLFCERQLMRRQLNTRHRCCCFIKGRQHVLPALGGDEKPAVKIVVKHKLVVLFWRDLLACQTSNHIHIEDKEEIHTLRR
jgi:hypothetical protein